MIVSLFDYGTGNLHSLAKALESGGASVRVDADPTAALAADALVLPGVGAFSAAARRLAPAADEIREALAGDLPCLGICLGMQLLFACSEEGPGEGLGFVPGRVRKLRAHRVPQMGWNDLEVGRDPLFDGLEDPVVYYANSYVAELDAPGDSIGWTVYDGDRFAAAVRRQRTWGVQFHPEKSSAGGLHMIDNFLKEASR